MTKKMIRKIIPYIVCLLSYPLFAWSLNVNEQTLTFYPFNDSFQYTFTLNGNLGAGESPPHIEAQVLNIVNDSVLINWTQLSNETIVNETSWTGELTVSKQNAEFYFKVRLSNDTGTTAQTTNKCSVAFIGLVFGQSNAEFFFSNSTPETNAGLCYYTTNGTSFTTLFPGYGGSVMANELKGIFNCPIVLIDKGKATTALDSDNGFIAGWWEKDPSNYYPVLPTAVNNMGGAVNAIFFHQGETDALFDESAADYLANERQLVSDLRSDLSYAGTGTIPWVTATLGRYPSGTVQNINQAKMTMIENDPRVYGIVCTDLTEYDDTHYTSDAAGYGAMAKRWAQCAKYHYGLTTWYRGPKLLYFGQQAPAQTLLYVQLNDGASNITPATGIDSIELYLDGEWINVECSVSSVSGNIAILSATHDSGSVSNARCLWDGINPSVAYIARDNTALALPIEPTWEVLEYILITDGISVSDSFSATKEVVASFSEGIAVSDTYGQHIYNVSFSDGIIVSDYFMKTRGNVIFNNVILHRAILKN